MLSLTTEHTPLRELSTVTNAQQDKVEEKESQKLNLDLTYTKNVTLIERGFSF